MSEAQSIPERGGTLRRNLVLIASYLFVLTLIAAGYQ